MGVKYQTIQQKSFTSNFICQVAVTVELAGNHTRGMMVLDYMELLKKKHKVVIMKKFDLDMFKQMLMDSMK